MNYLLLSEKKWNEKLLDMMRDKTKHHWELISTKEYFNLNHINRLNPQKVFIPHWSHIIPREIYEHYECIVFHMTDLPFGRGGSPLQNLIERGIYQTKISALKVEEELDSGPVYLKKDLSLLGSAEEIFIRANAVIEQMIIEIIQKDIKPIPQEGDPVNFKRRKKEQSCINGLNDIEKIYDYIRMLDAEGYPKAYIEINDIRLEFSRAQLKADNSITADVRIFKK